MKVLRSIAVWAAAGGLLLCAGNVVRSQQGSGRGGGSGLGSASQGNPQQPSPLPTPTLGVPLPPDDPNRSAAIEEEQAKLRNTDRQRKLVDDTQKLLSLANELKVDVDKSNKDTLSLDVIKKADEIEKLAHSVKERMKGT
jgi:hypothetical protein